MKHLYIIGNGFDLHHHIPSRYLDYREWLENHYPDVLYRIENYFDNLSTPSEWNNFEQQLAEKDFYSYAVDVAHESMPDFSSDEFSDRDYHASEINAEIDSLNICTDIEATFSEWIDSLPNGNIQRKLILSRESRYFITFNYSLTLERVYNIPLKDILYIHGRQGDDRYVLGHGKNKDELQSMSGMHYPEPPEEIAPEQYEEWYSEHGCDMFIEQAKDSAIRVIAEMKKNIDGIIQANQDTFSSLKDVQIIHIYGFSFSPIDMPYLYEIAKNVDMKNVQWKISYYSLCDKEKVEEFLAEFQIPDNHFKLVKLDDLMESHLQYKLAL